MLIDQMFTAVAKENAAKAALVDDTGSLTYAQFEEGVARFADILNRTSIQPGDTVLLYEQQNFDFFIALFALFRVQAVVTVVSHRFSEYKKSQLVEIVKPFLQIDFAANPVIRVDAYRNKNLQGMIEPALAVFTSGSTGLPKGVVLLNSWITNLVEQYKQVTDIDRQGRCSHLCHPFFAFGMEEILLSVLSGGTLFISADRSNIANMLTYLRRNKIDTVCLPAAVLNSLQNNDAYFDLLLTCGASSLIIAGEKPRINAARLQLLNEHGILVYNNLGTTETGTVMVRRIDANASGIGVCEALFGKAFFPFEAAAIDPKTGNAVQIGEEGLLFLRIPEKFLNTYELMSGRPVFQPVEGQDGLLYTTNDVLRRVDEHTFAYVGRHDDIVKLHGYRIMLFDIEAVLRDSEDVNDAIVFLTQNEFEESTLAALVVKAERFEKARFLSYLALRLEQYQIPAIQYVTQIPRSDNGKKDKITAAKQYQKMAGSITQKIVELLGKEADIFETDLSFASLGIDSLSFLALICELEQIYSIKVDLERDMGDIATPTLLVRYIRERVGESCNE